MRLPEINLMTCTDIEREHYYLHRELIKACHEAIFSTYELLASSGYCVVDLEKMLYDAENLANHIDNVMVSIGDVEDICNRLKGLRYINNLIMNILKKTDKAISYDGLFHSEFLKVD